MGNDPILAALQQLNDSVSDLLNVVRVTAYPSVKATILSEFADSESDKGATKLKRQVYALSDGKNSSRDIERILGTVKFQAVARYQQQWRKQGLAVALGAQGKTKAVFDLEDFGLNPDVPASKALAETQPPERTAVAGQETTGA